MAQRAQKRLSSRGRHRKPSSTARNLTLATAPLLAVVPMATASPAAAAGNPWDRLAGCESGQRWNINTGNGYHGGLQFSPGTWTGNGGGRYAGRADLASRMEQIVIAAKVLDGRGWSPWPSCSSRLGLDGGDRRVALDLAEQYRARLNGDSREDTKAEQRAEAERQARAETEAEREADKHAEKQADAEQRDKAQARADQVRTTQRATRGKHRKAATTSAYVVRRGDTLARIAARRGVPGGWAKLYRMNKQTIGSNPGLIFPGQRLTLR